MNTLSRCLIRALVPVSIVMCGAIPVLGQQTVASESKNTPSMAHAADVLLARPLTVRLDSVRLEQAVFAVATKMGIRVQYRPNVLDAITVPVTLHAMNMPLGLAFNRILAGTNLEAVALREDVIVIAPMRTAAQFAGGIIVGKVTDARTRLPINGVSVSLDGATKGVITNGGGLYRLSSVIAGPHTLLVKCLGYARQSVRVTVTDDAEQTQNVVLEPSANQLDQVVVTGTVIPTELKAVPNAITVITAEQIERRGITRVDQLFRGDVPGLFALNGGAAAELEEVTMFSRGATAIQGSATTNYSQTNPIKTYVDGVELTNSQWLSQIDPRSIERIEILTGPQASTIYGSNAINGVMQIFTKRGTTAAPRLTLNLMSGWVQNGFNNALTPQHDYSAQASGVEGRISYNIGSSWNYLGQWAPSKQTARLSAFGGTRLELPTTFGKVTADVSLRHMNTHNRGTGDFSQGYTHYWETGWYEAIYTMSSIGQTATTNDFAGQTLGLTFNYVPTAWWSHEVGIGQDVSDTERRRNEPKYAYIGDTSLLLAQSHGDKRSLHYNSTLRVPVTSLAQATVTAGVDGWRNLTSSLFTLPGNLSGNLAGSPFTGISRSPEHNTGAFLQAQVGIADQLFLTYGLRAEWNPTFGTAAEPNRAPRYGIAYSTDVGPVTAKVRASYGRSTRPPAVTLKRAQPNQDTELTTLYGVFNSQAANPELTPEYQQGGEGGLELYFGRRGSLVITRYNQTVDALIVNVVVADSVRSLQPNPLYYGYTCAEIHWSGFCSSQDAAGYGYARLSQNINAASIRNQGWELQGSVNTGPFTTKGTYSWTKSRTIGVDPKYRDQFLPAVYHKDFQPGATYALLPEHTWALGVTYAVGGNTVAVNVTGSGAFRNRQNAFSLQNLDFRIRLSQNQLNVGDVNNNYYTVSGSDVVTDLTASHRFTGAIEGLLQIQDLTNRFTDDFEARFASLGRQAKAGLRVRL